ncbi:L-cysteine desulfidase family protein [Tepidimicrobium xylanilyticum]|uniref:UPF0597 protein SAMN05660923_01468 n=1 Tax=Tepidimicrobium xylanilyticum TaxID=1123352 RepID=A0A1H2XK87_9FIRM|nr:L-serine ammonia-lyase, iron-sulfur-dependent, subunit alpha [Tepidimicrobium xylanilyticum]GMG97528.1 UPF0597 protein [Tepidimicrobium xylanilyticum]SDW93260.1 L-cysteine desulfidase [Tepidimicrobium xylanilyticum]
MVNKDIMYRLLNIINEETVPALGCTEPVAVAYAASVVNRHFNEEIDRLEIKVSKNIFKNGKSVIIPYTKEWGLDLAGALGVIAGNPEDGLMVLKDVKEDHIRKAHRMLKEGRVTVNYIENTPEVYVEVLGKGENRTVEVVLKDAHNHIYSIKVNGETIYKKLLEKEAGSDPGFIKNLSFEDMIQVTEGVPLDSLLFIVEGINMNKEAAKRGLEAENSLNVGRGLIELEKKGKIHLDAPTKARILTALAADMRMGGGSCPIMTSSGSGNQGIGVFLPITVVAEENNIEDERLIRAIFLALMLNKYVKLYTGKLSAMCGCAIGAGVGASGAIAWMLGGNQRQIGGACNNVLANLTGIICDGAKDTCALKLSTSVEEAILSAFLAIEDVIVRPNIGIIGDTIEETIKNLELLCKEGFCKMDSTIIHILNSSTN